MAEKWSFLFVAYPPFDTTSEEFEGHTVRFSKDFEAEGDEDAKKTILHLSQEQIKSLPDSRYRPMIICAPYKDRDNTDSCDAERLIRLKEIFTNERLLAVQNPEVALVQGYGHKAHKAIWFGAH